MANNSSIEWTEATWNPTTGCTKISPGCKNCYAERLSLRLQAMGKPKYKNAFKFTQHPDELRLPLKWKKPKKIFVNSMSDIFHEDADTHFTRNCFYTMIKADWHIYQVLTKRPHFMAQFSEYFYDATKSPIPPHIWCGTSVENKETTKRIDELKKVKCITRFLSCEPLLEDLGELNLEGIDWVIVGGESGPNCRPIQKEWVENIIRQCKEQNVKVFFKQWGGKNKKKNGNWINGKKYEEYPEPKHDPNFNNEHLQRIKDKWCITNP